MKQERFFLDPSDDRVMLDGYLPDLSRADMPAILVIAGGGYACVCDDREGEPIALAFLALGYAAFVLHYRVGKPTDVYPAQLLDASRAILFLRQNAARFSIDPSQVYAVGFSAGGHLCGSLACAFDDVTDLLGIEKGENRPTAVALAYPVVTLNELPPALSFSRLLNRQDNRYTPEEIETLSLDLRVNAESAPMFLWHTAEDEVVAPQGTLLLAAACVRHHVPCAMELYPFGPHGASLGSEITAEGNTGYLQEQIQGWPMRADRFFRSLRERATGNRRH